jgi:tol-pal system protein YbgF
MRIFRSAAIGLLSLALVLVSAGCASRQSALLRTEVQDLQNRIYELQKRNAEAQVEIQELRERSGAPSSPGPNSGVTSPRHLSEGTVPSSGEPEVPGSTIDLGESGPTRNVEPPPAENAEAVPEPQAQWDYPAAAPPDAGPGAGNGEADKSYLDGYAQFNSGDYAAAEQSFQQFLARAPESDLADDAQYWIGECFFSRKDHRRAILEFRKVVDQYPFGNRVPHAFLKIGLSYLALGDRDRAAENLETVVQAFPKSDVATVARATLDEIHKP